MTKNEVSVEVAMPAPNVQHQELFARGVKAISDKANKKEFAVQGCGFFVGKRR